MTNLQKRDLSQNEAFAVYPKIQQAFEAGDFEGAVKLNEMYERLTENAMEWEQAGLSK